MSKKYNVRLYEPIKMIPTGKQQGKPLLTDKQMEELRQVAKESIKKRKEIEAKDEEYKKLMDLVLGRNKEK